MKRALRCCNCGARPAVAQDERTKCWHVFCIYCHDVLAFQWAERDAAVAAWNEKTKIKNEEKGKAQVETRCKWLW